VKAYIKIIKIFLLEFSSDVDTDLSEVWLCRSLKFEVYISSLVNIWFIFYLCKWPKRSTQLTICYWRTHWIR
jgi:hypothetical protein